MNHKILLGIIISAGMLCADPLNSLKPLLIDLPGWNALPASGFNSYRNGIKMINASRRYTLEDKSLQAVLLITNQTSETGWLDSNMQFDFSGSSLKTEDMDGFKVFHLNHRSRQEIIIVVVIRRKEQENIYLALRFKGVAEETAWDLAIMFDWNTIEFITASL